MMRTKQFTPVDLQINKSRREILAVASTDNVDRDNEVVIPSGLRMSGINYAGRPILWAHDHKTPALGTIQWIKPDAHNLLLKYRMTDKGDFANLIFDLIQDDMISTHSIGFETFGERPPTPQELRERPDWQAAANLVTDYEVIEVSICNVPCNANTQVIAKRYSPELQALLGPAFQVKECWDYSPVEKAVVIPKPTYSRKWKDTERRINELIRQHDASEIIARVKGLA